MEQNIKQKLRNRGTAQEHRLKMRTEALFVPKVINQYEHLTGQFAQLLEEELFGHDEVLAAIFDECNNEITPIDVAASKKYRELFKEKFTEEVEDPEFDPDHADDGFAEKFRDRFQTHNQYILSLLK